MNILAIESSSAACSVALLQETGSIVELFEIAPRQQAQLVLQMTKQLLSQAQLNVKELNAIAFACGPGSFTGLRIAASFTQGLAFAANLPVIAVSTLQTMAQGAYEEFSASHVLTALDARMQEIYWGAYSVDGTGIMQPEIPDALLALEEVSIPCDNSWLAVGDGWREHDAILATRFQSQLSSVHSDYYPHARCVAKLASLKYQRGELLTPEQASPRYLRGKEAWKKSS